MAKLDNKIFVLTKIREKKDVLFSQFSDAVTKEKKVEEWTKICEYCKALGLVNKQKDFTYVRDVFWSNVKRATLAKKDNANKTGTPGVKSKTMTPLDEIVLEIIHKDIPTPESIVLPDMMLNRSSQYNNITIKEEPTSSNELDNSPEDNTLINPQNTRQVNTKTKTYNRFVTNKFKSHEDKYDLAIKKRKAELQLEFLALQNYKMKLDIYEMEARLSISHSEFTKDIVRRYDGYPHNIQCNDHTGSDDNST